LKIKDILAEIEYKVYPKSTETVDREADGLVYDSRKCREGAVFVCLSGAKADGHLYAADAYEKGVRDFICERKLSLPPDAVQYMVASSRIALARASAAFFGHPERKLKIIGITGTKGKTTVAYLIHSILKSAGKKAVLIGTAGTIDVNGIRTATKNTTPESYELSSIFAKAVEDGGEYAVMEVSSQAYLTHRVESIEFDVGVYTNLSEDHIGSGEHPNFDNYRYCKSLMFANSKVSVINSDDKDHIYMKNAAKGIVYTYGLKDADYVAEHIDPWKDESALGIAFDFIHGGEAGRIKLRMPGVFSVYNALAAASVCNRLGIENGDIARGIEKALIPGRFEIVEALPYCTVIIDYAHNELSLRSALETLKAYEPKRLVCLFGSVGGRSQLRRAALGRTGGEWADMCILTSDNPDGEEPLEIIADIEDGIKETLCPYTVIADRAEAICYAIENAREGDLIFLAGKGHEDYQLIGGIRVPFSERETVMKAAESVLLKS